MAINKSVGGSTMALNFIKRLSLGAIPYYSLGILLVILAYLLSAATQDSSVLNDLFLVILAISMISIFLLIALLSRSLLRLYSDYKTKQPGAKLTIRLVSIFAVLILVSTSIVYSFSIHFLHRGIDSWFDVKIEQALNDSLELSRTSFSIRMRTLLRQTRMMANLISELPSEDINHNLRETSRLSGAIEFSLWTMDGQLLSSSTESPALISPNKPNNDVFRQLEKKKDYISLDPDDDMLRLRVAVPMQGQEEQFLQALFPVNDRLSALGHSVQKAYTDYKELNYLRKPLISLFTLTLSMIVLLTLLASIWFAIWLSRRIVQPLQELAEASQAVASGNYNTNLAAPRHDEIGFLVRSFNQMTQRLTQSRHATQNSHQQLEQQTHYLTTVLGSLSSGVITIDNEQKLQTANVASNSILQIELQGLLNSRLNSLGFNALHILPFIQLIKQQILQNRSWQQQVNIQQKKGLQSIICNGTPLPDHAGWVIVFDDVTTLLQAQRNAAWGEVARRLAHEIKNPLTPIQLSAERLQHKYLPLLAKNQTQTLTKLTNTIVKQVEAMKEMVNDFSDYARNPGLQLQSLSIRDLLHEVLSLYQSNSNHRFVLQNSNEEVIVHIDSNRFRQVIHNLLKNAIEASEEARLDVNIVLRYHTFNIENHPWLEITFHDHGPGIPDDMVNNLFEPYASNKIKGTGLGLAIVKKIIEEHDGHVWAENNDDGACITLRLPLEERTID